MFRRKGLAKKLNRLLTGFAQLASSIQDLESLLIRLRLSVEGGQTHQSEAQSWNLGTALAQPTPRKDS